MRFNIQVNGIKEITDKLSDLQQNQIPFALSKALNTTAYAVQDNIFKTLPDQFKLRTGWWQPRSPWGFKVVKAEKRNLIVTVGTEAPWMMLQESGGLKVAHNGHKYIAIPTDNVPRTGNGLIREDQRPAYLLRGFTIKGSNKRKGIYRQAAFTGTQAFIGTIHNSHGIWLRMPNRQVKLMY